MKASRGVTQADLRKAYDDGAARGRQDAAAGVRLGHAALQVVSMETCTHHELAVTWRDGYRVARDRTT